MFVTIGEVNENTNMPMDSPKITIGKINDLLGNLRSGQKVFLFIFMTGCGHCDNAKPAWKELSVIKKDGTAIVMLNQELLDETGLVNMLQLDESDEKKKKEKEGAVKMLKELLEFTGPAPTGFPSFKVISGKKVEEYDGNRDVESFKKWIEEKSSGSMREQVESGKFGQRGWVMGGGRLMGGDSLMGGGRLMGGGKRTKKSRKSGKGKNGGKWSRKYKKSINCKRPKGFSQKQYCKYGRK
jgi:hypothetical protein